MDQYLQVLTLKIHKNTTTKVKLVVKIGIITHNFYNTDTRNCTELSKQVSVQGEPSNIGQEL